MEYWEVTKNRAQLTRAAWEANLPTQKIGTHTCADLEAWIAEFEPLVQERTLAQDNLDEAYRAQSGDLLKMKILGSRVPAILEAMLEDNEALMKDLRQVYATQPRTENTTLQRARLLVPVWLRANAALAALPEPQPPVTRTIQGQAYTAAMLKALIDNYSSRVAETNDKQEALDTKRTALRSLDARVDNLNKRWYKFVKNSYDPGTPPYDSLNGIPTEPGTPAPETVEIDTITQGGEEGTQVLVAYIPGGGAHATTKKVLYKLPGETGFPHHAPLDFSGNALGPFPAGTTLTLITQTTNSSGTRTTAPRTITLQEPIT